VNQAIVYSPVLAYAETTKEYIYILFYNRPIPKTPVASFKPYHINPELRLYFLPFLKLILESTSRKLFFFLQLSLLTLNLLLPKELHELISILFTSELRLTAQISTNRIIRRL